MDKPENHSYLDIMVRVKLNNMKMAGSTLKIRCLERIVRHRRTFCRLESETGINPFIILPQALKTDLLTKAFRKFDSSTGTIIKCKFLQLLVHPGLQSFELPFFRSEEFAQGYPRQFKTLLEHLVATAPNLIEIKCYAIAYGREEPVSDLIFSSVCQLKKLQVLKCPEATCNDVHLVRLAENLPNLRHLVVSLKGDYPNGFEALSKLEHLETFYFNTCCETERREIYYQQCAKFLPKLKRADNALEECRCQNFLCELNDKPVTLFLEHISLEQSFGTIPDNCVLPNVRGMDLSMEPVFPQPPNLFFSRFDKLTKLSLSDMRMTVLTEVLSAVGKQLLRLDLTNCSCGSMCEIFTLCPTLEEFSFCFCSFPTGAAAPPKVPFDSLRHLRVLKIEVLRETFFFPGAVHELLHAPQLKRLQFPSLHLEEAEGRRLANLVRDGVILNNLESVECYKHNLNVFGCILIDHIILHRSITADPYSWGLL